MLNNSRPIYNQQFQNNVHTKKTTTYMTGMAFAEKERHKTYMTAKVPPAVTKC